MRKGQVESVDLFIAVGGFLLLSASLLYFWNIYNIRLNEEIENEKMQLNAFHITDLITKTPGLPSSWEKEPEDVEVIGLAASDRVISSEKVDAFISLDYNSTKDLFNINAYDYTLRIKDLGGTTLKEAGINQSSQDVKKFMVFRYVMYNDQKALLEFAIWK